MSDILDDPASIPLFEEEDPQALLAMEPSMPMHAYMMHGSDQPATAPSGPDQPQKAGGLVLHLIATSTARPFISRLVDACEQLEGAYSLVFLTEDKLVAVRDPHGFRLLVMGRRSNAAVVFASETCALDLIEAEYEREVNPGEVVVVDKDGMSSLCLLPQKQRKACVFKHIYFALPSSVVFGCSVYESRYAFGQILAEDAPVDCDVVIAVPDSGVVATLGYAAKAWLSFQQGLIGSHYMGWTFIEPSQKIRDFGVKLKLSPVHTVLEGKCVLVVDDSIVRGTTSSKIVRLIKDAGATEVHVRIASPPIIGSCYYDMDTPSKVQLYLTSLNVAAHSRRVTVARAKNITCLSFTPAANHTMEDTFCGSKLWWMHRVETLGDDLLEERWSLTLKIKKRDRAGVLSPYLRHLEKQVEDFDSRSRDRKLYTNKGHGYRDCRWTAVSFRHPAMFSTLALDPELKENIKADLDLLGQSKEFYHHVRLPWKRGYLLYCPPGTGKSSLIAAMVNYLHYNVYDLELTKVTDNSELRALLIQTANKSMIVIEDIDCSTHLSERALARDVLAATRNKSRSFDSCEIG